jgi:Asp-tRNA(Asn)/Glu-tRNA(Gln) amidotransferase A subunit family amidase
LLQKSKLADERWKNGTARKLEGIPFTVKMNFATEEGSTTCASAVLQGNHILLLSSA